MPHARFLIAATLLAFSLSLSAAENVPLPGLPRGIIGFTFRQSGDFREIQAVTPNSPAGRAGIQRGDYVIAVDGRPTAGLTAAEQLLSVLQGPAGSPVQLTLRKSPGGETVTVTLLREGRREPR